MANRTVANLRKLACRLWEICVCVCVCACVCVCVCVKAPAGLAADAHANRAEGRNMSGMHLTRTRAQQVARSGTSRRVAFPIARRHTCAREDQIVSQASWLLGFLLFSFLPNTLTRVRARAHEAACVAQ